MYFYIKGTVVEQYGSYIVLDKDKHYKIFFHFKSRNDEVGTALVYENLGYANKWREIGYCKPKDKNRY